MNQNQILDLLKDQSETSKVIQGIIRNHHDVYNSSFELDLERIVRLNQVSFKTVIQALKQWHKEGNLVLDYAQTDIQIQWLVPREDQYTLAPLLKRLEQHQKVKKEKIEAMITFAFSTDTCKQKQILSYFGEHATEKCGRCNALECLPEKQAKAVQIEIKNRIAGELQNGSMSLKELDQSIADYTTLEIGETIRLLLNSKELLLTDTNKLKLNI